ncbi:response regulator transcription factor [Mucilaginibacter robiniae]|uniref:Response regulator transcription factor n=1 Tax=Mucilaginibacter robiniae TaxID=2728022 RepID=A0A7L5DWY3_9SPHI|nr:response regulator transcription factor [Mucilaginibacter robiniae]QJD94758.1 response regulator transcription factor [Mucilaginibacter robiniae]
MSKIHIAIADDQKLFSQALAMLIGTVSDFELLFVASDGLDFLEQLKQSPVPPQVAMLDIDMPGMDGVKLNKQLQKDYPQIKVIMLSVHLEEELITRLIEDGAAAYLNKNCDKEDLIKTIHAVMRDGFYINQLTLKAISAAQKKRTAAKKAADDQLSAGLTKREIEVLVMICEEKSNSEIADKLFISVRTVEGHRNNLLIKSGCRNTVGLVLFALRHNFFKLPE